MFKGKHIQVPDLKKRDSKRPPFAINRRMVDAFLTIGLGHGGMEKFGMEIGMNVLTPSPWKEHLQDIEKGTDGLKKKILEEAHASVRKEHKCPDSTLQLVVSTDGTWQKRGHISLHGVGFVIDFETGLVLDYEVLSRYCHIHTMKAAVLGEDSEEYQEWFIQHKELGECQANHDGSAGAMEATAPVAMWQRSQEQYNMQYTKMLADGDTSSLANINELQVYGPDLLVEKEECINHVAKRLTNGLKKAVADCKEQNISLGGRGEGKLTENNISTLTSYYRNAIVDYSPDVKSMQQAIMATLNHVSSTDKKPNHGLCPKGLQVNDKKDNWGFYNRAKALKEKPGSQDKMSLKLSPLVVKHIKPFYGRLSSEKILTRCTMNATQNANESLHAVVWKFCPKEVFVTRPRLEVAVARAVSEFNMGSLKALNLRRSYSEEDIP